MQTPEFKLMTMIKRWLKEISLESRMFSHEWTYYSEFANVFCRSNFPLYGNTDNIVVLLLLHKSILYVNFMCSVHLIILVLIVFHTLQVPY